MLERPPPSLRFRERSVFDGVARREIGAIDVGAHSTAVLVPSLTALGSGLAFPSIVGPGFWISTVVGFGIVWLLGQTFNEFSSRFNAAGSLYTFVAKGLGPLPALMVAGGLMVGYGSLIGFGLSDAASRAGAGLVASGLGGGGPLGVAVLFALSGLMCLYAMSRGIHWSTRAALVAESASLVVLVLVLGTWVARYGWPTGAAFSLQHASASRILLGAGLIVTLTLAFESSASLGLEARRPIRAVPSAARASLALAAGLFALANVVSAARPAGASSVWSWRWFAPGADRSLADGLVLAVLAWSLVALALCVWCALARLVFSLAREGVLPGGLGRVTRRGIPMTAALAVAPVGLVPPLVAMALGVDAGAFSWELKESAGVVICVAYALAAAALPRLLWSIDEVSPGPVTGAVLAGLGAAAVASNELLVELLHGRRLALGLLALSAVLGLLMHVGTSRRRRAGRDQIGLHDEALASAVLVDRGPRAS